MFMYESDLIATNQFHRLSYLNPFLDYSSLFQPSNWYNALRWCHHPNTFIEIEPGVIKSITELRVGDTVVCGDGHTRKIENILISNYSGTMVKIHTDGGLPLEVTDDHNIFACLETFDQIEKVKAGDLSPDYWLVCPTLNRCFRRRSVPNDNLAAFSALDLSRFNQWCQKFISDICETLGLPSNTTAHSADEVNEVTSIYSFLLTLVEKFSVGEDDFYKIVKIDFLPIDKLVPIIYKIYKLCEACNKKIFLEPTLGYFRVLKTEWPIASKEVSSDDIIPRPAFSNFLRSSIRLHSASNTALLNSPSVVFRKVNSIVHYFYEGPVYSLTVEGTHDYIANGYHVANCEYIVATNGILRSAIDRVVSFFITDLEVENVDLSLRKQYYKFLIEELRIIEQLRYLGMDYITYGNFFASLVVPIKKRLTCERCGYTKLLDKFHNRIRFNDKLKFYGVCDGCNESTTFLYKELRYKNAAPSIKRWNIFDIHIVEHDEYSGEYDIAWNIPGSFRELLLQKGTNRILSSTPTDILKAAASGQHIKFSRDFIFHGKEESLSGIRLKGWGLSRVFSSLRQAWFAQVLHRMNEAIGLDYVIPLRIITPMPRSGGGAFGAGDPIGDINFGQFASRITAILDSRRRDPTLWHVSPYPLDYKSIGGDGRVLSPRDLIEFSIDQLLNSMCIPMEFYRGSLQLTAAPLSLRLLVANWSHLVHTMNRFLSWLALQISKELGWPPATIRLSNPTHIDDANRQLLKTQLALSGQISKESLMKSIGMDYQEEMKKQLEEQVVLAQETAKAQERMQTLEMGKQMSMPPPQPQQGLPPQGAASAAPAGAGGGMTAPPMAALDPVAQILANIPQSPLQNINPQEINQLAEQLAAQIAGLPEAHKDSALRQLKIKNELLWMVVKERLNDMRAAASRQGIVQGQQQAAQMASGVVQPPV